MPVLSCPSATIAERGSPGFPGKRGSNGEKGQKGFLLMHLAKAQNSQKIA